MIGPFLREVTTAVPLLAYAAPVLSATVELKILGIALAVGLDVLALSIAVGILQVPLGTRLRLGVSFACAEVAMQLLGYWIGTGAGRIVGTVATYVGFAILAGVGAFIIREGQKTDESALEVHSGLGLLAASASISLDSLGIGVSLPGVPLPLIPLLTTVAVSTIIFTAIGLAFGLRLGARYKRMAQTVSGIVLVVLAVIFTVQHVLHWAA